MANDLRDKYGIPDRDIEEYKSPYEKGDGHEETALFVNKATIYNQWFFDNGDFIFVDVTYDKKEGHTYIEVVYVNKPIADLYQAANKSKNMGDL
jgi:hypothetical protein